MTVADIMTRNVVTATPATSFKDAADAMVAHEVGALPVLDDLGRVIGIVSEADLVRRAAKPGRPGPHTVGEVMTTRPVCIGPDESVIATARVLHGRGLKHLPVVDRSGALVGVVARHDVLGAFARPDSAIDDDVRAVLSDPTRTPEGHRVHAELRDGIVSLVGEAATEADRHVLTAAVWHIPGIVDVVDEIHVVGPPVRLP